MGQHQERVSEEVGYRIEFARVVRKDLKKLAHNARATLSEQIEALSENPRLGEPLHGILRGIWKYEFTCAGTSYRIAYRILEKERVVLVEMVGSREGFYQRLQHRVR
jgi:addiction module RelE/StbE family toxin